MRREGEKARSLDRSPEPQPPAHRCLAQPALAGVCEVGWGLFGGFSKVHFFKIHILLVYKSTSIVHVFMYEHMIFKCTIQCFPGSKASHETSMRLNLNRETNFEPALECREEVFYIDIIQL